MLNIQDPILLQRLEDEVQLPNQEREYLLQQNEELRQMVKDYLDIRMKLFAQ